MFLMLDGNNLAWAGYYALERAMKPDDEKRRARVAMLGLGAAVLGTIARNGEPPGVTAQSPVTRVALVFDEGRPLRRRQVYADYQTGRERDPKFMQNEPTILGAIAEFCAHACPHLPIEVVRGTNTEADDLIAGLVQANPRARRRIVSTDRDFLQLVGPTLDVYAPVKKLVIGEANFNEAAMPKTTSGKPVVFPRERFLDFRALTGDSSDDLPGVPGMGPLSAAKLMASNPVEAYFGNARLVWSALERKSEALGRAFADGSAEAIVQRNRTLMDLRLPAPCWDELDALTSRGTWNREKFEPWLKEQRFSAIDEPALFPRLEALAKASEKPTGRR
jgi:DNA polymerase-1